MIFPDVDPYLRFSRRQSQFLVHPVVALDHRIFFCLEGTVTLEIDGTDYKVLPDSLLYWNAGLRYSYKENRNAVLLGFNFDMTQMGSHGMPIPPELNSNFRSDMLTETAEFTDYPELNGVIFLEGVPHLRARFIEIEEEYAMQPFLWAKRSGILLTDLLLQTVRENRLPEREARNKAAGILEYIRQNYRLPLSNQNLGDLFSYHPNYINRLIVRHTGISLHSYLIQCRIRAAIGLLETTGKPIGEIAEEVGFREFAHFSKCFRARTGQSPSAFRQK